MLATAGTGAVLRKREKSDSARATGALSIIVIGAFLKRHVTSKRGPLKIS